MRNYLIILFTVLSFISFVKCLAFENNTLNTFNLAVNTEKSIYGIWNCSVSGATPEYQKSTLFINKGENGTPTLVVQLSSGTIVGHDVEITETMVKFNLNIEGVDRVTVILEMIDDTLKGNVITSEGNLAVSCTRKTPPQSP